MILNVSTARKDVAGSSRIQQTATSQWFRTQPALNVLGWTSDRKKSCSFKSFLSVEDCSQVSSDHSFIRFVPNSSRPILNLIVGNFLALNFSIEQHIPKLHFQFQLIHRYQWCLFSFNIHHKYEV